MCCTSVWRIPFSASPAFYTEFRRLDLNNRKLETWDWRHREFNEVWAETLNKRPLRLPKSVDEQIMDMERNELLYRLIDRLPEIQRRRFLLYFEYGLKYYQIGLNGALRSFGGKTVC